MSPTRSINSIKTVNHLADLIVGHPPNYMQLPNDFIYLLIVLSCCSEVTFCSDDLLLVNVANWNSSVLYLLYSNTFGHVNHCIVMNSYLFVCIFIDMMKITDIGLLVIFLDIITFYPSESLHKMHFIFLFMHLLWWI